jgi:hypothetical protein
MTNRPPEHTTIQLEADLAHAEADLQTKVAQLKDVVEDKLATPKHIVEAVTKPLAWVRANPRAAAAVAVGLVGAFVIAVARRARHPLAIVTR